jgi:hypothetical protein
VASHHATYALTDARMKDTPFSRLSDPCVDQASNPSPMSRVRSGAALLALPAFERCIKRYSQRS